MLCEVALQALCVKRAFLERPSFSWRALTIMMLMMGLIEIFMNLSFLFFGMTLSLTNLATARSAISSAQYSSTVPCQFVL